MNAHGTRRFRALAALASLILTASVLAGSLTPPPGPIAGTMKPLSDIEPRIALNATNTPGNANSVYRITQAGSYYLTSNLSVPSGKNGIVIVAASVTIDLNGFVIRGTNGSLDGIYDNGLSNPSITVRNGSIDYCGGNGIHLQGGSNNIVRDVMASLNGASGIAITNALVDSCQCTDNMIGFSSLGGCIFKHCSAYFNYTQGFNGGQDIYESCTASYNETQGFSISSDSTIRNCLAEVNTYQGIVADNFCTVVNNQCRDNGGNSNAGIWLSGSENRCEGNDFTFNGYGIYVSGTNNIIMRNTGGSSYQATYYILPGNHVATIVSPSSNATLINGSGGGGFGTTDPYANFVY